jgi:hypothetical protein
VSDFRTPGQGRGLLSLIAITGILPCPLSFDNLDYPSVGKWAIPTRATLEQSGVVSFLGMATDQVAGEPSESRRIPLIHFPRNMVTFLKARRVMLREASINGKRSTDGDTLLSALRENDPFAILPGYTPGSKDPAG